MYFENKLGMLLLYLFQFVIFLIQNNDFKYRSNN